TGRSRLGDERADRALPFARAGLPIEAVPLALGALQALRELENAGAPVPRIVFALGIDVGQTHLDRRELVAPDAAIEELLVSGVRVPEPRRAVRHQRNGQRVVVVADIQDDLPATALQPMRAIVGRHEPPECRAVGDVVTRPDYRNAFGPEDLDERL